MNYDFSDPDVQTERYSHKATPEGTDQHGHVNWIPDDDNPPMQCARCMTPWPCSYRLQYQEWKSFQISMEERMKEDNLIPEPKEIKPKLEWWEVYDE